MDQSLLFLFGDVFVFGFIACRLCIGRGSRLGSVLWRGGVLCVLGTCRGLCGSGLLELTEMLLDHIKLAKLVESVLHYSSYNVVDHGKQRNAYKHSRKAPKSSEYGNRKDNAEGRYLDVSANDMRVEYVSVDKLDYRYKYDEIQKLYRLV